MTLYRITSANYPDLGGLSLKENPNGDWGVYLSSGKGEPVELISNGSGYFIRFTGNNEENKFFGSRYGYVYTGGPDRRSIYSIYYDLFDNSRFNFGRTFSNAYDTYITLHYVENEANHWLMETDQQYWQPGVIDNYDFILTPWDDV